MIALNQGKDGLREQFVKVIEQLTKEVTNDVIKNTAVVSVNKLNNDITDTNNKASMLLQNMNSTNKLYEQLISRTDNSLYSLNDSVAKSQKNIVEVMIKVNKQLAQETEKVNNSCVGLNKDIAKLRQNLNNICQEATVKSTKDIVSQIMDKSVLVEMSKFEASIARTKAAFGDLLQNIEKINAQNQSTKESLAQLTTFLDTNIDKWIKAQGVITASIEELQDKQQLSFKENNDANIKNYKSLLFQLNLLKERIEDTKLIIDNGLSLNTSQVADSIADVKNDVNNELKLVEDLINNNTSSISANLYTNTATITNELKEELASLKKQLLLVLGANILLTIIILVLMVK